MDDSPVFSVDQARSTEAPPALATALRHATHDLHRDAERSGVVAQMLRGTITRGQYAGLLRNLLPAYQQIEHGLEQHCDHPHLRAMALPAVYRAAALQSDLAALAGPDWAARLPLLQAGRAYADRIAHATATAPALLIAHGYVRYLGDLNGGQMLQRRLATALGLDDTALAFYRFEAITDLAAFRRAYRDAIDAIRLDTDATAAVLAEAQAAFQANIAVSVALAA